MATHEPKCVCRTPRQFVLQVASIVLLATSCLPLLNCGSKGSKSVPHPATELVLSPPTVTLTMGASVAFKAVSSAATPQGGSWSWVVTPSAGGTVTNQGVYTAGTSPGNCTVIATWTLGQSRISGSAAIKVLATPQSTAVITPELVQASGGNQGAGAMQNSAIVGEAVAPAAANDNTGRVQIYHGFKLPICANSNTNQQSCVAD